MDFQDIDIKQIQFTEFPKVSPRRLPLSRAGSVLSQSPDALARGRGGVPKCQKAESDLTLN